MLMECVQIADRRYVNDHAQAIELRGQQHHGKTRRTGVPFSGSGIAVRLILNAA